jgi:hypothetical protein
MNDRLKRWEREAAAAVPTSVVRDLVADFRVAPGDRGRSPIAHEAGEARPSAAVRVPHPEDPPGWGIIARMMDHQDAQDRADRLIAAAKRRAALQRSE